MLAAKLSLVGQPDLNVTNPNRARIQGKTVLRPGGDVSG
jgi:hypothetical protein